jgi:hypothetical protein
VPLRRDNSKDLESEPEHQQGKGRGGKRPEQIGASVALGHAGGQRGSGATQTPGGVEKQEMTAEHYGEDQPEERFTHKGSLSRGGAMQERSWFSSQRARLAQLYHGQVGAKGLDRELFGSRNARKGWIANCLDRETRER